jgi:hypothetical protein
MHKQITNWLSINCTRWIGIEYCSWNDCIRRIGIEYSIVGNHQNNQIGHIGIGYLIVGMIVLGGLEDSIVGMIGVSRSELNI